jgi:hypothetical protein
MASTEDRRPVPTIDSLSNVILQGPLSAGPGAAFVGTFDATHATFTGLTISGGSLTNITLITPTVTNPTINGGTLNNVTINNSTFNGGTITGATIVSPTVSGPITLLPGSSIVGGGSPPATIAYSPTGFNWTGFFDATNSDWTFNPLTTRGLINKFSIAAVTNGNPILTPPDQITFGLNFFSMDNGPYRFVVFQIGNPVNVGGNCIFEVPFNFDAGTIPPAFRPLNHDAKGVVAIEYSVTRSGVGPIFASRISINTDGAMQFMGGWMFGPGGPGDPGSAVVVNAGMTYAYLADGTVPI